MRSRLTQGSCKCVEDHQRLGRSVCLTFLEVPVGAPSCWCARLPRPAGTRWLFKAACFGVAHRHTRNRRATTGVRSRSGGNRGQGSVSPEAGVLRGKCDRQGATGPDAVRTAFARGSNRIGGEWAHNLLPWATENESATQVLRKIRFDCAI